MRIAVVDFGAGNLRSVAKALDRVGFQVSITSDPNDFSTSEGVAVSYTHLTLPTSDLV